jgi:hypothetical protein
LPLRIGSRSVTGIRSCSSTKLKTDTEIHKWNIASLISNIINKSETREIQKEDLRSSEFEVLPVNLIATFNHNIIVWVILNWSSCIAEKKWSNRLESGL